MSSYEICVRAMRPSPQVSRLCSWWSLAKCLCQLMDGKAKGFMAEHVQQYG